MQMSTSTESDGKRGTYKTASNTMKIVHSSITGDRIVASLNLMVKIQRGREGGIVLSSATE